MPILYKQDGETLYGVKEYMLESADELKLLPTNIHSGSMAMVIPTSEIYILNSKKNWIPFGTESKN